MKLEPWEPDLRTLYLRWQEQEIDLQPGFQRGIAWNRQKQQRLIDTLLRGWSIPPIHVLVGPDERLEVLDGQQRLHALFEFIEGKFRIAPFEPEDESLANYVGKRFNQLPPDIQRRIHNYKISTYRLYEYKPEEPYELFFRLNLPTGLTQAEKRNALFGPGRGQVRELVDHAATSGNWSSGAVGFGNTRMAYDDTLSRVCLHVERRSLRMSVSASEIERVYRSDEGFSDQTVEVVGAAIEQLAPALGQRTANWRLNKATLSSWLLVAARQEIRQDLKIVDLTQLVDFVEVGRLEARSASPHRSTEHKDWRIRAYLDLYNDRASLRVTDALSVVARDVSIWRLATIVQSHASDAAAFKALVDPLRQVELDRELFEFEVLESLDRLSAWSLLS